MLQIVQYQKSGEIIVEDLPSPICPEQGILVKTMFSLISAGTEKFSVTTTQSSLIQRAKSQPEQFKLVIDNLKKEGILNTIDKVRTKLDSYKNLGYSSSGIVIESKCSEFHIGDRVACAGAGYAVHSEIVAIPKNLATRIPDNVEFQEAAYTTVGSIALQGIRQADVRLGENVAVIGLGLLGQITLQMLKASGCKVIGLDINESLFNRAKSFACDECFLSNNDSINLIKSATNGLGCDAVIITASTSSNQPIELAIEIARKKAKVVVVGAVTMDIQRNPFYTKELDITISCSYGPGRYDPDYEERGIDYPFHYVRWTENRNMQAVLELISQKKLDVNALTTHTFLVNEAKQAYNLLTGDVKEDYLGILIDYSKNDTNLTRTINIGKQFNKISDINIGFVGAGAFAQSYLLPNIKAHNVILNTVSTTKPVNAITVAKQFSFQKATTDNDEIFSNPDINVIFCATLHDTHSDFVYKSIKNNKAVFVEKPLAINYEQLDLISKAVEEYKGRLLVGFNRRFSESFVKIKKSFNQRNEAMVINYRVNSGKLPTNHWVYLPEQGEGRIIGEVCHFIDCMVFLTDEYPVNIYTQAISESNKNVFNDDNIIITIKFSGGSVGVLSYLCNGDSSLPKEYCEVFCGGVVALMKNFTEVQIIKNGKTNSYKMNGKKGHKEEIDAFLYSIKQNIEMPISYQEIKYTTLATFAAKKSLETGVPVTL